MAFGILLLIILFVIYVLLIEGYLWKLLLGIFAWCGMYWFLNKEGATGVCMTILGYSFTWSQVIPTVVIILAMACTKDE